MGPDRMSVNKGVLFRQPQVFTIVKQGRLDASSFERGHPLIDGHGSPVPDHTWALQLLKYKNFQPLRYGLF